MKRKILITVFALLLICFGFLGYQTYKSIVQCSTDLTVSHYSMDTNLTEHLRIVQLTDLHSHSFGTDNAALAAIILQQNPDLIVMTGDMMDKSDENPDVICSLIRALSAEVPVFYGYGNHEKEWMSRTGNNLTPLLTDSGAIVLDCEYVDATVNGQHLRIGGYHGYYRQPGMYSVTAEQRKTELDFAESFENSDRYKILLCHIPTAWLDWGYIDTCPVNLVITGHYHGGQIRLPFLGGLYAPYIGFLPEYTDGLFIGQKAACVLSRGLGSSPGIPRVNNIPEITVMDLNPKK